MGVGARVQSHKEKLNKETNDDNFGHIQKPRTTEGHRSVTSHFNIIKKHGQKVSNRDNLDYYKQTYSAKKLYKKNEETGTLMNKINCGGIGTLK